MSHPASTFMVVPKRLTDDETRLAMWEVGLEPLEPYPGSHTPWRCRCMVCGSEVRPHFSTVKHRGSSCDICARKVRAQSQTIPDDEAVAIMVAAGVQPLVEYPGGLNAWLCQCLTCKRICSPSLSNITRGQGSCRHWAGKWDADDCENLMRKSGLEPLEPYPGSHTPWRCRCMVCGGEVEPHFSSVKHEGSGCRICDGQLVTNEEAVAVMRAAGLEPLTDYVNATSAWPCRCSRCEEVVTPTYSSVRGGGGCRICNHGGFNPSKPAIVYLIQHSELRAIKIGITGANVSTDRLRTHHQNGWSTVSTWPVVIGYEAEVIESTVIAWWRGVLNAQPAVHGDDMPQHGKTETASLDDLDIAETVSYIDRLVASRAAASR